MTTPATSTGSLISSLPDLEASLAPLYDKPWSETVEKLDTLERAKIDILLSYAINDLIWVYLKLKAIDPAEHDVTTELDRIKKYYSKVKLAEEPESQRKKIDAGVATRFISASIPKSQRFPGRNLDSPPSTSAAALAARQAEEAVRERIGMSGRFRFVAEDSERVVVGQEDDVDDEEDQEEEEEQEEEIIGDELQHDGMELEEKNTDQVEAFMKDFEDEMQERETGDKSEAVLDEGEPKKKKSRTNKNKGKK